MRLFSFLPALSSMLSKVLLQVRAMCMWNRFTDWENNMSGGNSFLPEAEKTPEERLASLEQMIPVFIQKIQSYDKVLSEFSDVKKSIDDAHHNLESHKAFTLDIASALSNYKFSNETKVSLLAQEYYTQVAKVNTIKKDLMDLMQFSDKIQKSLSESDANNKSKHIELINTMVKQSAIDEIKSDFYKATNALISQDNLHQAKMQAQEEKNSQFISKHNSLSQEINSLKSMTSEVDEKSVSLAGIVQRLQTDMVNLISLARRDLGKEIEKNNLDLKKSIDSSPATSDSIKKEVSSQIEAVALDGRNALLKSNNSSQQIALLEKKIENLYLLLKKFELSV